MIHISYVLFWGTVGFVSISSNPMDQENVAFNGIMQNVNNFVKSNGNSGQRMIILNNELSLKSPIAANVYEKSSRRSGDLKDMSLFDKDTIVETPKRITLNVQNHQTSTSVNFITTTNNDWRDTLQRIRALMERKRLHISRRKMDIDNLKALQSETPITYPTIEMSADDEFLVTNPDYGPPKSLRLMVPPSGEDWAQLMYKEPYNDSDHIDFWGITDKPPEPWYIVKTTRKPTWFRTKYKTTTTEDAANLTPKDEDVFNFDEKLIDKFSEGYDRQIKTSESEAESYVDDNGWQVKGNGPER